MASKKNIGIIGDTHFPFCHPKYLDFCYEVFNKFQCTEIVHIGDEVDNHAISFHSHNPDGHSPSKESELAQKDLNIWYKRFPNVKVCIGNHSALHKRKAQEHGLPNRFIKSY
jgi:predicted phosphodiesterase